MVIWLYVLPSRIFSDNPSVAEAASGDSDEKRAEDALARRWDRLMAEKASVSEDLLSSYTAIFGAADMEADDGHMPVCIAVHDFFLAAQRLPRRFHSRLMRIELRMCLLGVGIGWLHVHQQSVLS